MTSSPLVFGDGFTAIPRPIFDLLLCLSLSKRDLTILLLVARLTYGCRNGRWAMLKQADLSVVGIGPTHARRCLQSLVERNLLVRNGIRDEYRIGGAFSTAVMAPDTAIRLDRLSIMVGRQLAERHHNGRALPEGGSQTFPKGEHIPYQYGNVSRAAGWSFSPSRGRFEKHFDGS